MDGKTTGRLTGREMTTGVKREKDNPFTLFP